MDVIYHDVKNEVIRDHDLLLMYTVKINEQLKVVCATDHVTDHVTLGAVRAHCRFGNPVIRKSNKINCKMLVFSLYEKNIHNHNHFLSFGDILISSILKKRYL